jgi:hypothetical protein
MTVRCSLARNVAERLGTTTSVELFEASYSPYFKLNFQPLSWMRCAGGIRSGVYQFDVRDRCPDERAARGGVGEGLGKHR